MQSTFHRHYVILPLLALSVLGTGAMALHGSSPALTAVSTPVGSSQGEIFDLSGMHGMLLDGARMNMSGDLPILEAGSVLITANQPAQLQVAAFTLTVLGGGYHVTKSGDAVTVAALTAPVLVEAGTTLRAVVPAGMQWRSAGNGLTLWGDGIAAWMDARKVTALPKRFLEEQRDALRTIPVRDLLPEPQTSVSVFAEASLPELPEAEARRREKWVEEVLGVLRFSVEAEDAANVQKLLLQPDLAEAFSTVRAQSIASTLLFRAKRTTALEQQLLPLLTKDPDLWLLLSLHPAVSTVVWTLQAPEHSSEVEAVRLLSFPFADISDDPAHAAPWNRWEEGIIASVAAAKNPESIAQELIMRLGKLALEREVDGYPERARFIARALKTLGAPVKDSLSLEAQEMLQHLSQLDSVDIRAMTETEAPVAAVRSISASVNADASFDASFVESRTRSILRDAGAAFSLETRIIPVSATRALVENIVFAGSIRDRTLTFTLDVERSEVLGIHEGMTEYPYAMPIQAFAEWVRK
ncbi:MAG: hypothetical protein Greene041662_40 [Candidatus Peregrinibacteria bacterium Greene0416_62]|nr:MAG: hypothetical protein Greene041662_40 [Candidatus Peregrinibacteria bacterium Greene0416_62]TSC99790.1 MAG: hypothetical protein Greene101449_524 [Candidatus Peregrinibacteria bacterium Greene1014_49]